MRTIPRCPALLSVLTVSGVLLCGGAETARAGWFFWRKKPVPPATPRIIYTPAPAPVPSPAQWPAPPPMPPPQGLQPAAYRPPVPVYPTVPPAGQPQRPTSALPAWQPPAPAPAAVPVPPRQVSPPAGISRPLPEGGPPGRTDSLTLECLKLARQGLSYQFGSNDPSRGGLDCSGAVQHVMSRMGLGAFPRTASDQYVHLEQAGTLTTPPPGASADWILQHCRRGDLLFWKGTYATGRWPDVSHVMIYLGIDRRDGKPKMFGASSRKSKGENGSAVDVYEFKPVKAGGGSGQFIGSASIPGVNVPAASWVAR